MKFLTLVVLPPGVSTTAEAEINAAVDALMAPFRTPWEQDGYVAGADPEWWFEGHHCYARGWIEDSDAPEANSGLGAIVLHRTDVLSRDSFRPGDGVASVVVTPDGRSASSRSTYTAEDPTWAERASALVADFPGHHAVVVWCKS